MLSWWISSLGLVVSFTLSTYSVLYWLLDMICLGWYVWYLTSSFLVERYSGLFLYSTCVIMMYTCCKRNRLERVQDAGIWSDIYVFHMCISRTCSKHAQRVWSSFLYHFLSDWLSSASAIVRPACSLNFIYLLIYYYIIHLSRHFHLFDSSIHLLLLNLQSIIEVEQFIFVFVLRI